MADTTKHTTFGKLGIILAAAGCAVGLGNIWKMPYMIGQNGGAAFLIVYLGCVLLFGIPLMTAEFYMGRAGLKQWKWIRVLTLVSATLFFAFYLIITGWCFEYLYLSIVGTTHGLAPTAQEEVFWAALGITLTALIEWAGIKRGIERASKILMPVLVVMLVVMIVYSLTLEGSREGLRFLFRPDFSKLSPTLVLNAMGQCFFSLSIGVGSLATYASYMHRDQDLPRTALSVIALDTAVAILAGMAIFPAVFALGINPTEGPQLVFDTLPSVFDRMAIGHVLQVVFFALLSIAALTSTISLMEVSLHFIDKTTRLSRPKGIVLTSASVLALSIAAIVYRPLFGYMDQIVSLYLLPAGGLVFALYVGWRCNREEVIRQMTPMGCPEWMGQTLYILVRYLIPPIIGLIFLQGVGVV